MNYNNIFNTQTLNIFTDASKKTINNISMGCPGYVLVRTDYAGKTYIIEQGSTIEYDSTNNNSEYKAILLGLEAAIKYRHQYQFINLFSDSKISVYGLREWFINNWTLEEGQLIGSSGPVSNQDVISRIIHFIIDNNFRVNLYHQKGHVTNKVFDRAIKVFMESNRLNYVDPKLVAMISYYNDIVDKNTKMELEKTDLLINPEVPIYKNVSSIDINIYKKLLGV